MKVLFIHHITEMHGSSISLFALIEGLKKRNVDIILVIPSNWHKDQCFINKAEELGITLYNAHIVHSRDWSGWSRKPWRLRTFYHELKELVHQRRVSYRQICKIVEEVKPDVVHTNVGIIHDGFWVARKYKIPHVFHLREYQNKDFGWKILPTKQIFELMLKKSSAVVTITDDIRKHFHLLHSSNACTVYNGIYTKDEIAYNPIKEKYFLCASRISPEKGCDEVIKAFSKFYINHKDYKLRLAGEVTQTYAEKLKLLAMDLKCEKGIELLGYRTDIKELIQHARALIVASYNEGFGRMTAEAALLGCLVIGRNTAGTKEILQEIEGLPFDTLEAIYRAMCKCSELTIEEYTKMVVKSQKKAINLYSIEQNTERMYSIYKSLNEK